MAFAASSLRDNGFGGYYDDEDTFISTTEGITALCEGLKKSSVTSLKCAAAPTVFAFVSAPADTPDLSPSPLCLSRSLGNNNLDDSAKEAVRKDFKGPSGNLCL